MNAKSCLTNILSFVLLISTASISYAQKKTEKNYFEANEALHHEKYNEAKVLFIDVASKEPQFEDTEFKLEVCFVLTDKEQAIDRLVKMQSRYDKNPHYHYWLAKVYLSRYLFEDAANAIRQFHETAIYNGSDDEEDIQKLMSNTTVLLEYFDNPDNYEIHQLDIPINSSANELSPVFFESGDELLFASNRNNENSFNIFHSLKGEKGWSAPTQVTNLGSFTEKNANIEVVNEDGKLFMYSEDNGGDLFFSHPNGKTWTSPIEFDSKISNNDLASHFFINEHEDRIIFSTDSRISGLDIYESFKDPETGKWSKPAPFSIVINSQYNEDSPYLSPDETKLYFLSDRPGGMGGFDVYVSELDVNSYVWSTPKNIGWPINSPDNEFHFKMNEDQTSGYFISDRLHTKGGYDIYSFWEIEKVHISGRLITKDGQPMMNAQIRFHPSQYTDEYFYSVSDSKGKYGTEIISDEIFKVEILEEGNIIYTEYFEVHDVEGEATLHIKDFRVH